MKKTFIHLKSSSDYSLLKSVNKLNILVDLAVKNNMPALAITDYNNLHGALEFSEYARSQGIQPIIGLNLTVIYQSIKSDIVLIAKNYDGYKNLIFLSGLISEREINIDDVFEANTGLIALSGNLLLEAIKNKSIDVKNFLSKLKNNFQDNFFIEVQRIDTNSVTENIILDLAYQEDIPIVATNEILFPDKNFIESHDILTCIAHGAYISSQDRKKSSPECYFKSTEEMNNLFHDLEEAIDNTTLIAKKCNFMPEVSNPVLPKFPCNTTEDDELRQKSYEGLKNRLGGTINQEYLDRLKYELGVIITMKYSGYFLIVSDFINWSKDNNIPVGPGRGSGVGSIVAWSLGITGLDPIKFGLLFERFLNPVRVSMPDFDIDFCQEKRNLVIDYIRKKYGHVAQIVTFGSLQPRAALRDVGRVLQLSYFRVDKICKMIPNNPANPITLKEAIAIDKGLQNERDNDPSIEKLLDISLKLEGTLRHASIHAAGIVISDKPITDYVPVYYDENSDLPITQFSMKYVEKAGLIKFDFLGLKTLTMINHACELIRKKHKSFDIDKLELNDKKTYNLLSSGRSIGVFQLENAFMCESLKKLKPDSIGDIIALISLNRPGPMANIPTYIARKHGKEKIQYPHRLLEKALAETFGVVIYQEQVMEIAKLLAGYTLAEADILRRAMGKKIRSEMKLQKQKFVQGAIKNNIDTDKAEEIFDMVEKFAGYGFNKSHGAAYAVISYQTAFLKANFPLEFFTALLNIEIHNTDKLSLIVQEAKNCGINILPPDVNQSASQFKIENENIRYALSALKNVGESAGNYIENCNEFKNLEDFTMRIDTKIINKRALEGLIKSGSLDTLHQNRAALFESVENILNYKKSDQIALFNTETNFFIKDNIEEWDFFIKTQNEFESIGLFLVNHPLNIYTDVIKFPPSKIAGIITHIRIRSRGERKFAIMQVTTTKDIYTVIFYETKIIEEKTSLFAIGSNVVLDTIKSDNGIIGQNIEDLEKFIIKSFQNKITIIINDESQILLLKKILKNGGNFEVIMALKSESDYTKISLGNNFSFSLKELLLIQNIKIVAKY
jgi:DNA polymerase-3 subunit alpha